MRSKGLGLAGLVPVALTHPTSHGVELVNASALLLLLLLNLLLIGRQDRLKRREVEWRLRGIIDQIQGETTDQPCRVGRTPLLSASPQALPLASILGAPGISE